MENIKEAVDKIHRDFHMAITTADEKLAEMLGLIVIDSGDRVRAMENYAKLKGYFDNAVEVTKSVADLEEINKKKQEAKEIALFRSELQLLKTITGLKFIHYPAVISLCKKYNLVIGDSTLYKETVPRKNAEDIGRFINNFQYSKISECIKGYNEVPSARMLLDDPLVFRRKSDHIWAYTHDNGTPLFQQNFDVTDQYRSTPARRLYTVGPIDYFDAKELTNIGCELVKIPIVVIPDPIVLAPINFQSSLGKELRMFAIVTAWGPEARDPLVFNEQLN
jgi:hypothetical protein